MPGRTMSAVLPFGCKTEAAAGSVPGVKLLFSNSVVFFDGSTARVAKGGISGDSFVLDLALDVWMDLEWDHQDQILTEGRVARNYHRAK